LSVCGHVARESAAAAVILAAVHTQTYRRALSLYILLNRSKIAVNLSSKSFSLTIRVFRCAPCNVPLLFCFFSLKRVHFKRERRKYQFIRPLHCFLYLSAVSTNINVKYI
jgi:hypothetical protein